MHLHCTISIIMHDSFSMIHLYSYKPSEYLYIHNKHIYSLYNIIFVGILLYWLNVSVHLWHFPYASCIYVYYPFAFYPSFPSVVSLFSPDTESTYYFLWASYLLINQVHALIMYCRQVECQCETFNNNNNNICQVDILFEFIFSFLHPIITVWNSQ